MTLFLHLNRPPVLCGTSSCLKKTFPPPAFWKITWDFDVATKIHFRVLLPFETSRLHTPQNTILFQPEQRRERVFCKKHPITVGCQRKNPQLMRSHNIMTMTPYRTWVGKAIIGKGQINFSFFRAGPSTCHPAMLWKLITLIANSVHRILAPYSHVHEYVCIFPLKQWHPLIEGEEKDYTEEEWITQPIPPV